MLKKSVLLTRPPWRLLHPPALSLPRQPLRSGTRLVPSNAATPRLTLVSRFTVPGSEARTPLDDFFIILLEERYDLALQRQTEHQRLALSEVHVQFTPNPKLAGQVDPWLNRKAGSRHQTAGVLRLQAIDVGSVAMNFFTDRMARAMDELITIAATLDDLPAGVVDFPTEWAMAGSYFCPDKGQGRVPSPPDQVENLAMFHRHRLTDIAGPGNIGVDRTALGCFGTEIDQELRFAGALG
jgi:hypothetical protein